MNFLAPLRSSAARAALDLESAEDLAGMHLVAITQFSDRHLAAATAQKRCVDTCEAERGFAVVADEVRKLATRTSQATQQAAQMIDS